MVFLILAFRNVFRNQRRTTLTFLAIISGMTALIVFGGFMEYSFWGLRESTIHSQLGHLQIYKKGYSDKGIANPSAFQIKNYKVLEKYLYSLPEVELVTVRLSFSGLISNGDRTLICKGLGVVPGKEDKLASFETLIAGRNLSAAKEDEAIIGNELKKTLGVKAGDYLTVLTTTLSGMINARDIKLVGVAQSGSSDYDAVFVKLPLKTVQSLLDTDSVEKVVVLLSRTEETEKAAQKINLFFKKQNLDLELKTWKNLAAYYDSVVRLYNGIFNVIKVIIAVVVLFSIANTMTMSIFERVKEIGTLRAIGTPKSGILMLFVWEGFIIGIIGGLLGLLLGVITAHLINFFGGIYIPPPPGMAVGYYALIFVVPRVLWYSFFSTVIVSTFSAIFPALKAIRLNIVEALGHV